MILSFYSDSRYCGPPLLDCVLHFRHDLPDLVGWVPVLVASRWMVQVESVVVLVVDQILYRERIAQTNRLSFLFTTCTSLKLIG